MSWSLAGNLVSRSDSVREEYPGTTIYSIGDQQHQSGTSDHNPDSRGIVHAIDVMTYSDYAKGNAVRDWCLDHPDDLEYVIFNHKIYERDNDFEPSNYYGGDPHEDHVHISGKHGSVGYASATGTGYDTAAEGMRPEGMSGDMTPEQAKMLSDINWAVARGAQDPAQDKQAGMAFIYWTEKVNESLKSLTDAVNRLSGHGHGHDDDQADAA